MAKTMNEYWIYLEALRRSGVTNMYGATPYLEREFCLPRNEAKEVLADWMANYNSDDYVDEYVDNYPLDFEDEE